MKVCPLDWEGRGQVDVKRLWEGKIKRQGFVEGGRREVCEWRLKGRKGVDGLERWEINGPRDD